MKTGNWEVVSPPGGFKMYFALDFQPREIYQQLWFNLCFFVHGFRVLCFLTDITAFSELKGYMDPGKGIMY